MTDEQATRHEVLEQVTNLACALRARAHFHATQGDVDAVALYINKANSLRNLLRALDINRV